MKKLVYPVIISLERADPKRDRTFSYEALQGFERDIQTAIFDGLKKSFLNEGLMPQKITLTGTFEVEGLERED